MVPEVKMTLMFPEEEEDGQNGESEGQRTLEVLGVKPEQHQPSVTILRPRAILSSSFIREQTAPLTHVTSPQCLQRSEGRAEEPGHAFHSFDVRQPGSSKKSESTVKDSPRNKTV